MGGRGWGGEDFVVVARIMNDLIGPAKMNVM